MLNNGCTGCTVATMIQNVDGSALEAGDVVSIVGSSAPVLGQQPVITVKKATTAYDGAVAGIVGNAMYVPSAQTTAAYAVQKAAFDAAVAQRAAAVKAGDKTGTSVAIPAETIGDKDATVHPATNTAITTNGYAEMLTSGTVPAIKVDASFGAIHAGDSLVASPHAGYAMKATDKTAAVGAVIGKALGTLESGTGTVAMLLNSK